MTDCGRCNSSNIGFEKTGSNSWKVVCNDCGLASMPYGFEDEDKSKELAKDSWELTVKYAKRFRR